MARRFRVKSSKTSKKALDKVKDKLQSTEAEQAAPRITNDTVAEHREEVLSGGRRFLYPLQHSKHKVVIISSVLIVILLITTTVLSWMLLYRWQSTSNFAYRVTETVPVPIARVGGHFVPYEKYLFELRSTIYYYNNHAQEGIDINGPDGEKIIAEAKVKALEKAKLDVLAAKLAKDNNITITDQEIEDQIKNIQTQGGIDASSGVLSDVLSDFYGWSVEDLRNVVEMQLIRQKLPQALDKDTIDEANAVIAELKADPKKFEALAKEHSDDKLSKDKGGSLGVIKRDNDKLPKQFIDAAFNLEEGQTTEELVSSPFGLHIIRVNKKSADEIDVSHILFRYFNINEYLKKQLGEQKTTDYIKL